jgi:hypothetical protein
MHAYVIDDEQSSCLHSVCMCVILYIGCPPCAARVPPCVCSARVLQTADIDRRSMRNTADDAMTGRYVRTGYLNQLRADDENEFIKL